MQGQESYPMGRTPWLAAYPDGVGPELPAHPFHNVLQLVEAAVEKRPNSVAMVCGAESLTFNELLVKADLFAAYLIEVLGIRQGDRVAVMLPNGIEFPICLLGILRAGAVQLSVNPQYTARELRGPLLDSGARLFIVQQNRPMVPEELAGTEVEFVLVAGQWIGETWAGLPAVSFETALIPRDVADTWRAPSLVPSDLALLQYTGGTTGASKGVELTHGNVISAVLQCSAMLGGAVVQGEETILTAIPLYHIFGLTVNFLTFFYLGARNVLLTNPRDGQAMANAFLTEHVSIFAGVNTSYSGILAMPQLKDFDLRTIKLAVGGGSAIQQAVSDAWHARSGHHILEGYGLSETTCVVSINIHTNADFTCSVGVPFPGTDVVLLDDAGARVSPGKEGEICVKGPQVMQRYWKNPSATDEAFTEDGYLRTGDIGTLDELGFLRICDRKKDMVVVSGFNVYPNEIEGVIAGLDGVAESAVTGIPDPKTGEAVKAFIVRSRPTLTSEEVINHCRVQLAAYKVPRTVHFVEALPKSPVGKILRRELRKITAS